MSKKADGIAADPWVRTLADGRVAITLVLSAAITVALRDGKAKSIVVNPAKLAKAGAQEIWSYGLRKKLRDGAGGKESKKKADKGRKYSTLELNQNAEKNAREKLTGLYSGDFNSRTSGLTNFARELRRMLTSHISRKVLGSDGKPIGQKAVPSVIAQAQDTSAMITAAEGLMKKALVAKKVKSAKAIAILMDEDDDDS
jgi:hypothetical protein